MEGCQILADSIIGSDHVGRGNVLVGKNNQDAFRVIDSKERTVAIVCDGCSAHPNSGIGAYLGANKISNLLFDLLDERKGANTPIGVPMLLETVRQRVLRDLYEQAKSLDRSVIKAINDCMLFTVIGTIIDRDGCSVFSLGDGCYALNGKYYSLEPGPGNEPDYLFYGVTGTKTKPASSAAWKFKAQHYCSLDIFRSVMIGTDGAKHFNVIADKHIPGKPDELVGGLEQFWTNDEYFNNPVYLHNRLSLINRNYSAVKDGGLKRDPGLLPDDVTFAVIRREPVAEE